MQSSVLVVAESPSLRQLLRDALSAAGFAVCTVRAADEALAVAHHREPDAILLDGGPGADDFLRRYRPAGDAPVLVVAAPGREADALRGLELGADGYVVGPFRMQEVVARVRALQRRASHRTLVSDLPRAG